MPSNNLWILLRVFALFFDQNRFVGLFGGDESWIWYENIWFFSFIFLIFFLSWTQIGDEIVQFCADLSTTKQWIDWNLRRFLRMLMHLLLMFVVRVRSVHLLMVAWRHFMVLVRRRMHRIVHILGFFLVLVTVVSGSSLVVLSLLFFPKFAFEVFVYVFVVFMLLRSESVLHLLDFRLVVPYVFLFLLTLSTQFWGSTVKFLYLFLVVVRKVFWVVDGQLVDLEKFQFV